MKAAINTFGHVLYAPSQYVIPVFQRNYRWERPQWDKLWASLSEIQQPEKTGNHFMGFLVFVQGGVAQPGQNTRFHLIDGQQRLTTTSLLLAALRNVAKRLNQDELAEEIHADYLVHPRKKGEYRYRLLPKAQDHDAYVAIIDGIGAPAGRMADALAYFETELGLLAAADPKSLRHMFDVVCQRLEFMCATLESESAYSIFKSLNSTGVPLGQADLIRNFVFMHVHPDDQDEFDQEHWAPLEASFADADGRLDEERFSRFFRDVLMATGQYVQPKDTFATFEARNEATGFDPRELVRDLQRRGDHYAVITGAAESESPGITDGLADLNRLESSTTYPLLLALFDACEAGHMPPSALARCIGMLRGFVFRRFVCGESSRGYGQMFVRAIDPAAADPVEALERYLLARGWPHDERFIDSFVKLPLYKRGYAREVLETLERARGHKEPAALGLAQVEHVMPQTLSSAWVDDLGDEADRVHSEWLHQPGNLTLSAYNQEVGNQPFRVKRERFAQSNIGLTRDIAAHDSWTEAEIRERGLALAQDAAALWVGPAEPHESEDVAVQIQETRGVRQAFWQGFAEHLARSHPEVPALEPGYKRVIRLKSGVPHVSLEVRYKVQEDSVAVDLIFHRKALPLWDQLSESPELVDSAIGEAWTIEKGNKGDFAWLTVSRAASSSDPAHWPSLYGWLGQKLEQVHARVLPYLRAEMEALLPGSTSDGADADDAPSGTRALYQRFWGVLADEIRRRDTGLRPQKPLPQHWTNLAIGRAGFTLVPFANSRTDRVGIDLIIGTPTAKAQFHALMQQRDMIEAQLGFPLDWHEMPDRIQSKIGCKRPDSPLGDETRWGEYCAWLADHAIRMDEVFRPLIGNLE
jgi:uncharacterized protein with ParB-like and HNH nuclease domain